MNQSDKMRNLFSQISSAISGQNFFPDRYLCDRSNAADRFKTALQRARSYYAENRNQKISPELIHASWLQNISSLEAYFVEQMEANFMSNAVINGTMVFTDPEAHKLELKSIADAFDRELVQKLIASGLNSTFLSGKSRRSTLINSIHHLHHLMRFEQVTGKKVSSFGSVVEFGGGYGNMGRIMNNFGSCKNYSIIDLLLFSCIQFVFLGTVAGSEQVTFDGNNGSENAKFLLHPLFRADKPTTLRGELFISTWALSESTRAAYEWVVANDWFGANSLLLAYNEHWKPWSGNELSESLSDTGWHISQEAIPFLPESYYLFATR